MIALFAFSKQGIRTAARVRNTLPTDDVMTFVPERLLEDGLQIIPFPSRNFFRDLFSKAESLIFVGSCGIAVREIAPFVKDKRTDPAVLCIDELGHFIIPLLSGHIGGANEFALRIAKSINAIPVITTATDVNHRFSADSWAIKNGFLIGDMNIAKEVSAAILEKDIPLCSMLPVLTDYPSGTFPGSSGPIGIFVGWDTSDPFTRTLHLIPVILHLGIGCKRGTSAQAIREAVNYTLQTNHIDRRAVKCAASIDLKSNEAGLLGFCDDEQLPLFFYTAEELRKLPGTFSASPFVEQVTGVDNVCERAAMVSADKLIVPKTVLNGVTVAVSAEMKGIRFD